MGYANIVSKMVSAVTFGSLSRKFFVFLAFTDNAYLDVTVDVAAWFSG